MEHPNQRQPNPGPCLTLFHVILIFRHPVLCVGRRLAAGLAARGGLLPVQVDAAGGRRRRPGPRPRSPLHLVRRRVLAALLQLRHCDR